MYEPIGKPIKVVPEFNVGDIEVPRTEATLANRSEI